MIGQTVSRYKIIDKIGGGGMGVVYKAEDTELGRLVALKFLPLQWSHDAVANQRFKREAQAASAVDHPNICVIHEIGHSDDDRLFIAMAYYEGETVKQKLYRGPLSPSYAIEIAKQTATGLAKVHELGIVHRDIKPANLLITSEGIVKILDFGLARFAEETRITDRNATVGTISYMSPEQTRGEESDHRTDLWSLGVTLHEMLTGQPPFRRAHPEATIYSIRMDDPPPLPEMAADNGGNLSRIVFRCLAKNPDDRYQRALDIMRDIERLPHRLELELDTTKVKTTWKAPSPSIAVLPFANLSASEENEYFSDGLTDELTNALAQIDGLQVVSRTSAFEFKGKAKDVRAIGEQLKVSTVLEGTVRKANGKLRITTQLTDVANGYCLWAERYDRPMKDVFAIQEEIAQTIVKTLQVQLSASGERNHLVRRHTENIQAYHSYLRGRYHWHQLSPEGFAKAVHYFEEALAHDPGFAPAYSGLADYYAALGSWSLAPPEVVWPQAKDAALKALELDGLLAEAHTSLGDVYMYYEWNWDGAEKELTLACRLNPGYTNAHVEYTAYLIQVGRLDDAATVSKRARETDPLSLPINTAVAAAYYYARQYDLAIEECRRSLEMDPNYPELNVMLGLAYVGKGMFEEAFQTFEAARASTGGSPLLLGTLGWSYALSGDHEKASRFLDDFSALTDQYYVAPFCRAMIYIGLGDKDRAFEWLESSLNSRDALLGYLNVWPLFDPLRADSRFTTLLKKLRLDTESQGKGIGGVSNAEQENV